MRKHFLVLFSSFTAVLLAALTVQAHDHTNSCSGFHGVANFSQGLVLTPTTNAPTGAKGKAQLIAVDDNGTNYALLFVKTTGLTNGAYTVSATDDTGTNTFDLGSLNVSTVTNSGGGGGCHVGRGGDDNDDQGDDDQGDNHQRDSHRGDNDQGQHPGPGTCWTNWMHCCAQTNCMWTNVFNLGQCTNLFCFATNAHCWFTNTLTVGSGSFVLPDGLTVTNIGLITVSDSSNNVVLSGDFSGNTNTVIIYKIIADVIPGTATNAQGSATISYRQVNSRTVGTFALKVTGLPACEKLWLTANAAETTNSVKVVTNRKGNLNVRGFRRVDVSTIQSVVATDCSSNVVFSVDF
jgi:hypothetical protein